MVVGIMEAARLVGKDRATIWRYAKQGKLSVSLDASGRKRIDTAELMRVFGDLQHPQPLQRNTDSNTVPPSATLPATPLHQVHELERLEAENTRLRAELDAERKERREMQDRYMAVIERLSLPAPTATPATSSNGASAPRPRRPRARTAAAPEAPTLAQALTSWLTGGR